MKNKTITRYVIFLVLIIAVIALSGCTEITDDDDGLWKNLLNPEYLTDEINGPIGKPIEDYMITDIGKPDKEWQDKKVWNNVKGLEIYEEYYDTTFVYEFDDRDYVIDSSTERGNIQRIRFVIISGNSIHIADKDLNGNIDALYASEGGILIDTIN